MEWLNGILVAVLGFSLVTTLLLWLGAELLDSDTVRSVAMVPSLIAAASFALLLLLALL